MLAAVPDRPALGGALGTTTQVRVTATYADKTTGDVTLATSWTTYRTSNVAVAKVDANGLVTGTGGGVAYITAVNEGVAAVAQVVVFPGDPLTAVTGFLRRPDGSAAVGSSVSLRVGEFVFSALVGSDGRFTFNNAPTVLGPLTLSAVVVDGGGRLVAVAHNLIPVESGVVDAGVLILSPFALDSTTKATAAGSAHTVALKTEGSLWTWGRNSSGQLGDGTAVDKLNPVRIGMGNDWAELTAGGSHTVARKTDGSLWAWGCNGSGQLGDGTTGTTAIPIQVATEGNWSNISASYSHTIALKADGRLWGWGDNSLGQLGDGTRTNRSKPIQIGTDKN